MRSIVQDGMIKLFDQKGVNRNSCNDGVSAFSIPSFQTPSCELDISASLNQQQSLVEQVYRIGPPPLSPLDFFCA